MCPHSSTPSYMLQRIKNKYSDKSMDMNVHRSPLLNGQKVETAQMSINGRMSRHSVVYPYNGILFSHLKKWKNNTCCNIYDPPKHYAKQNKSDTKSHIVWFHLHDLSRIETFVQIEQIGGCQGCWGGRVGRNCLMHQGFTLEGCFRTKQKWWLHNIVNEHGTELFTLKSFIKVLVEVLKKIKAFYPGEKLIDK